MVDIVDLIRGASRVYVKGEQGSEVQRGLKEAGCGREGVGASIAV